MQPLKQTKPRTAGKVLRTAIYPRVSTEDQALHGDSLQAQEEALLQFAADNQMKVVRVHRDEGNSARKPALKRSIMLELLEDVKAGKIDHIIFTKLDRWTRNVSEFHSIQRVLDEHGVTWQAILEDYNTMTADGRLKLNIMLSVAENESDRLGERIRFVFNSKLMRREAYYGAQRAPYGYTVKVVDGVKRVVKDPQTEHIVSEFFKFIETGSISAAARHLNDKYGLNRAYTLWNRMAHNEVYTGVVRGVDGFCEPYVTKEEWARLNQHNPFYDRKNDIRTYLFTGLLVCGSCGRRMSGKYVKNSSTIEYYYYRCYRKQDNTCDAKSMSEKRIETYLLETTRAALEGYVLNVNVQAPVQPTKKKSQVDKLQEKLRRLNVSYFAGNLNDDDYLKQADELKAAITMAEIEAGATAKAPDIEAIKEFLSTDFEEIYGSLTRNEQKLFWRSIIKAIHINDGQITKVEYWA